MLHSTLITGSKLHMFNYSLGRVCPVYIFSYNCLYPFIIACMCTWIFTCTCALLCLFAGVGYEWWFVSVCMRKCMFMCIYSSMVELWTCPYSFFPRFHVKWRCLISSLLLTKQSRIRCLAFPQTLSVNLSRYMTPETKKRQLLLPNHFTDRNWSLATSQKRIQIKNQQSVSTLDM